MHALPPSSPSIPVDLGSGNFPEASPLSTPHLDFITSAELDEWASPRAGRERARRANEARNSSGRRRAIDPTTCERDYTAAELEFLNAIQEYKQRSGRMFPTWSEVLEVLKGLGYRKEAGPGV